MKEPSFTVGIEEEYLLIDPETRNLASDPPQELFEACEKELGERVSPEFLRAQIEVGTKVSKSIAEARSDLIDLRRCIRDNAEKYGLKTMAASTHPFAKWEELKQTDKARYDALAERMQAVVRRLMISGMHVHVGIDDDELRIDLMNQVAYFLPHLLALSTSSPFWQGRHTGLKSYRIAVWHELPRTGLPEQFESFGEYRRHVDALVQAGVIDDATFIWWDIRPSDKFPTLEMRICDLCPRLKDTIALASIYRCLLRMLWRLRRNNQRWRRYANMLVDENRWRAQRYGTDDRLVDFGKGEMVAYADLLAEIRGLISEDAAALGCLPEVEHAATILQRGTSAHGQLAAWARAREAGADKAEAAAAVVDWLIRETEAGLDTASP